MFSKKGGGLYLTTKRKRDILNTLGREVLGILLCDCEDIETAPRFQRSDHPDLYE